MPLVKLRNVISKALSNGLHNVDYEEVLPVLRELRNTAALEGRDFQLSVLSDTELTSKLLEFVDKMYQSSPPDEDSTLAFSIGVQCVVNLMNDNDEVRRFVAKNHLPKLISWLQCEHPKQQNYVAAALLNVDKVKGLDLGDTEFVRSLIKSGSSGVEFSVLLLQNLVKSHHFCELYDAVTDEGKLFLLQILESDVTTSDDFVNEVQFICSVYKKSCDNLMTRIPEVNPSLAQELAVMLELLASVSYKPIYMDLMQTDTSLVISSAYLLRGIHESVSQTKTWKESLDEAVNTIKNKNKEVDLTNRPFFGVKGNLIRLLGNLVYKNHRNQSEIRDAGCIPIILDSCKLDGENLFIKEWSILTIRNLCEGNFENQKFIKDMKLQGYEIVQELSLTLDGGANVNIAPLKRK